MMATREVGDFGFKTVEISGPPFPMAWPYIFSKSLSVCLCMFVVVHLSLPSIFVYLPACLPAFLIAMAVSEQ